MFSVAQQRSGPRQGTVHADACWRTPSPGAPSYSTCSTGKKHDGKSERAGRSRKLSPKILQTLTASDNHGSFRTKGRYSAATVRGTQWVTEDRCDGTLTKVKRGKVNVLDFHTRKTITLHAGHSFLAKAVL